MAQTPVDARSLEERITELESRLADLRGPAARSARRPRRRRAALVLGVVALAAIVPAVALAGVTFNDVPPGDQYFNDIAAIASAGVTVGCGNGNYCPDDFVTREQMAAFLNRLGALGPGKPPKVNADRLDGIHANELVRLGYSSTSVASPVLTATEVSYHSVAIIAPFDGLVLVTADLTGREQACLTACTMAVRLRHAETGGLGPSVEAWIHERTSIGTSWVFGVNAGLNTFQTRIRRPGVGDGNMNGWYNQMTALFVPFGMEGDPPD